MKTLLFICLAACAPAANSEPSAITVEDERFFEAWVPYATGTEICLGVDAPSARDVLAQLARDVRAGDATAVIAYDRSDPRVLCAAAHLVEDVGGLGHDAPSGEPSNAAVACHNMVPEHRRLLRLIFADQQASEQ